MTQWWDPRTWGASERVTSPLLNKYVRDAFRSVWHEIAYVEFSGNVLATSGGTDVVTSGAITYPGYPVFIEFYAPGIDTGTTLRLYDATASVPNLGDLSTPPSNQAPDVRVARRLVPTPPGSHTYKIVAAGSGNVRASAAPGHLRITQRGPV